MLFNEPCGSDHVGLSSPTLNTIRPNLNPIFDGIEVYTSEVCAIDEVGFSLQWHGFNQYYDQEREQSRNDAILLNLLAGGRAVDVARTAAMGRLASDYKISVQPMEGNDAANVTVPDINSRNRSPFSKSPPDPPLFQATQTTQSGNHTPQLLSLVKNSQQELPSSYRPYYCPVKGCYGGGGGKGFKRKKDIIRHALQHKSLGYVCPYCMDDQHKYPRSENLQRHVRVRHADKDKDDPLLREVISQRPKHEPRRRRQHGGTIYNAEIQDTAKDQCDRRSQDSLTQLGPSLNPGSLLELDIPTLLSTICTEARTATPQQIPPSQVIVQSSIDCPNSNDGHPVLHQEAKGLESTCTSNASDEPGQLEQHFISTSDGGVSFTDSRSSSLQRDLHRPPNIPSLFEKPQCPARVKQLTSTNKVDGADAKTSYSAATTVGPVLAQYYIAEVCADICSKLRQCFDGKLWSTLCTALPMLIEAFAIKIGHGSSNQVNREIMYFIHKRLNQVLTQLEAMLQCGHDGLLDGSRAKHENMSLDDKMGMWDRKSEDDRSTDGLYQGVTGDKDEINNQAESPVYHKVIFASPAYEWLLSSLRNQIILQWSAKQPNVMAKGIRQRILDHLPTGTVGKQTALFGHKVKFDLQWGDAFKGWLEHERNGRFIRSNQSFAEFIVVTGSAEEAQVLTVQKYLCQTWPKRGPQLIGVLQNAINSHDHCYSVRLLDNTELHAQIGDSHLIITATGPTQFISECGEQLAWLKAALSNSSLHHSSYRTPSITSYWVSPSLSESLNCEGYFKIESDSARLTHRNDSIPRIQNHWHDLVKADIIVGYPIPRRPESYPGLELSFNTLLHLIQADKATIVNGSVLLQGQNKTIQLMKHDNRIFLWHPLHSKDQGCSCCTNHQVGLQAVVYHSHIDLNTLNTSRHIFSNCAGIETDVNTDWISDMPNSAEAIDAQNLGSKEINRVNNLCLGHNQHTIDQDNTFPVSSGCRNDTAGLASSTTSIVDHTISPDGEQSFQKDDPQIDSLSSYSNLLGEKSQPNVATGSPTDSFESDLLSMSDTSEQIEPLDSSAPEYPFLYSLLQELLLGFRSRTQCQPSPGENRETSVTQPATTASTNTTGSPIQCQKRRREQEYDDDASEGGFRKRPRKKTNPSQSETLQRTLACPYLKLDPITHQKCCRYRLKRIRDVKQHLNREHVPEYYCQRCFKSDFRTKEDHQSHVNLSACPIEDPTILNGLSPQQQRQLHRKSIRGLSEEEQWFGMWIMLFPRVQRPLSAYMGNGVSEDMRLFREYCLTRGPAALEARLESSPAWLRTSITEEERQIHLRRVIAQGIDSLFEEFMMAVPSLEPMGDQRTSSPQAPNDNRHPTQLPTPTDSNADSGMALGSQVSDGATIPQSSAAEFDYQLAPADDQVQFILAMQELTQESTRDQGQNSLDPAFGHYFNDQLFGTEWSAPQHDSQNL